MPDFLVGVVSIGQLAEVLSFFLMLMQLTLLWEDRAFCIVALFGTEVDKCLIRGT